MSIDITSYKVYNRFLFKKILINYERDKIIINRDSFNPCLFLH